MNTLIESAPARTDVRPVAVRIPAGGDAARRPSLTGVRLAGALAFALPVVHLVLAVLYVPRYPDATDLVAWSSVAVPVGMIAIAVAMWLTRAASRSLLAVQLAATAVALGISVAGTITADRVLNEDAVLWAMLVALSVQYLVALNVLARGAWGGILRWLPIAAASWGPVVVVASVVTGGLGSSWWAFIVYVCSGVALTGLGLLARPQLARQAGLR
jgi:hypothetical protein